MLRFNRTVWTLALLAGGLLVGAASVMLETAVSPVRAQVVDNVLPPAQLSRLLRLSGEFAYTSGTSMQTLHSSIVSATQALDASAARVLRAQLEATLLPARRVQFAVDNAPATGTRLQVKEGALSLSTPLTGVLQNVAAARTGARLSQQLQNSTLVQIVENRGLRQERRFSLNGPGSTLTLDVRVTGKALAAPVQAQFVYQRL